jgi:hypothetical protein
VSFPTAPRRPSRVTAAALLLILHLVAIELFLSLKATRDRPGDRLVTLLLSTLARPVPTAARTPDKPAPSPRPKPRLVTVLPVAVEPPQGIHDSSTPVAAPQADAVGTAASAASAAGGALNLAIPKEFFAHPPPLTPAQEAMRDPRSNRLVLTRQEQMDVDFGVVECIAWQREPDGSIYRGPGHYQRIQGISSNPFTAHKPGRDDRGQECVK